MLHSRRLMPDGKMKPFLNKYCRRLAIEGE